MYSIYKLTFPSGKIYVGITKYKIFHRLKEHWKCYKRKCNSSGNYNINSKIARAFRKYGICTVKYETLHKVETELEAQSIEKYYISILNTFRKGYNSTKGGESSKSSTQENRVKISKTNSDMCILRLGDEYIRVNKNSKESYIAQGYNGVTKGLVYINGHEMTSEEYTKSDYKFHSKGRAIMKDIKGNIIYTPINDNYETRGLTGITKGFGKFKNNKGELIFCKTDDPRVKSGELVGYMKGRRLNNEQKKNRINKMKSQGIVIGNPKRIVIFDNNNVPIYYCYGNFKETCKNNNIPILPMVETYRNLTKMYYNNGISKVRRCNQRFLGWYARLMERI